MKLARFSRNGKCHLGKVIGDQIVDLTSVAPNIGGSMRALIAALPQIRGDLEAVSQPAYPLAEVSLEAPITDPQKFLAIGMNYKSHVKELVDAGVKIGSNQTWFNKQVSCINGPFSDVEIPAASNQIDYEAELAVVIGKRCRNVRREDARSVIAGYMVCNDVTARDWQFASPTFTLGKSFDTHGPIGPWITTDDEIRDPHALEITLEVNGVEKQRTLTDDMVFDIFEQIEHISTVMTLEPGDVIATGTPGNVGVASGSFLKAGDVVRVNISDLGSIENTFVAVGNEVKSSATA